jgi:NAD(P)-dependent dehydrogenase (short-subunit alcohol dehydrogenase family)
VDSGIDLTSKRVLVTGGSLGIGFAAAQECLRNGASVVICARNPSEVANAADKLRAGAGERVDGIAADITDAGQIEGALDLLDSRFGAITSLIHAAAVQGPIGDITVVDPAEWLNALRIDVYGAFLTVRQACKRMKRSGGRIVMFSGGGAATPRPNFTAYAAGKAGVVRLAETIALEMAPFDIEINALAPGFVATRMAEEIETAGLNPGSNPFPPSLAAEAAAFLISDSARGITGKMLAAPYDGWRDWPEHLTELQSSDIFTIRRIVPRDRGMDWQ